MKSCFVLLAVVLAAGFAFASVSFTDFTASPSTTSAVITYQTDANCTSQAAYGNTTAYGKTATNGTKSVSHRLKISSLKEGTAYHVMLKCKFNATATDNSSDYSFTTTVSTFDLAVTDADVTGSYREVGGKLKLDLTVRVANNGNAKATGAKVKVEGAGTPSTKTVSSIPAGGTGLATFQLTVTEGATLTITVDPENKIAETEESNNRARFQVESGGMLPNLFVNESKITYSPSKPKTGGSLTITAKIKNNGSVTARNVLVRFERVQSASVYTQENDEMKENEIAAGAGDWHVLAALKKQEEAVANGVLLGETRIIQIAPGAEGTAKVTLTVPAGVNSLIIAVTADPENAMKESNENDNRGVKSISVDVLYPELYVNASGITFNPSDPEAGEKLTVKAQIGNSGTMKATGVTVEYLVSVDGKDYAVFANKSVTVNAKSKTPASADWTVTSGVQTASFRVRVNPSHAIEEKNYSNNEAEKNISISLPDLAVSGSDISVTGSVVVGGNVVIKANVSNKGDAKAQNAVIGFYYVSPSGDQVQIGTKQATISAGARSLASVQWTVPSGIPTNPVIMVQANPGKLIYESDFGNNAGTLSLNAKLPDLVTTLAVTPNPGVIPSSSDYTSGFTLTATVQNAGTVKAESILVRIMRGTTVLKEETTGTLQPGASANVVGWLRLNRGDAVGAYSFSAVADPLGAVTEATKANNEVTVTAQAVENQPPNAVIAVDKTSVLKGEWVEFNCYDSTDPETTGSYFYCQWKFGDGSDDETGGSVGHAYATSGTKTVTLSVTDRHGSLDSATTQIVVQANQLPHAEAGDDVTVYKGEESYFSPMASYDSDGGIASVSWSFGDGSTDTTGFEPAAHTYANTGTYTLTMTVTDADGGTATDSATVWVVNAPPMTTKTGSEIYTAHTYTTYNPAGCPCAAVFYATYKIDYELKYTESGGLHTLKSVKYTLHSGPAIITAVSDADEESLFQEVTAAAARGYTALQVSSIEVRDGTGHTIWSADGGPHLSGSESPVSMSYTGLDIPIENWNGNKYVVINSDVAFPGQMCAAEQYQCQYTGAVWKYG